MHDQSRVTCVISYVISDVETLQDLLIAAFRDALKQVEDEMASQMSSLTGGLGNLGGLGGGLGGLGGGLF